ncbi:MAG TPA: dTDP-4-dehydrorhamnose 3,5-epimerase [Candidatus Thermoplasmatota archaeon]|nr:dTDP-4-dehydrorhamnose 3,5-epimerase [Candidatus Thermoplasmatota archaeon]
MPFTFHPVPALPGVVEVLPRIFGDARGRFQETWKASEFAAHGIPGPFVQDNSASNPAPGTLRGLHYQVPPQAQGKLVRCLRGRAFDVAVDLRPGPTQGRWHGVELDAAKGNMLWVPPGFAHGYCTLEADTEVAYKVSGAEYAPAAERSIRWDDATIGIRWPIAQPLVADKDARAPGWHPAALPLRWD